MPAAILTGCRTPQQTGAPPSETILEGGITADQLRLLDNQFVMEFCGRVESTADEIIAGATDPRIRHNALLWKINAIPAAFQAASHADTITAHVDLAVLTNQMLYYFDTGSGSDLFGDYQTMAVQASLNLRERLREIETLLAASGEDIEAARDFIQGFVRDHPLENIYFNRASVAPKYVASLRERKRGLFAVVGDVTETLEGLNALLADYAEYIPKQARWQAELMLAEIPVHELLPQFADNFDTITRSTDRMSQTLEQIPDLIREERATVLEEIDRERVAALKAITEERIAVLNAIREERTSFQEFVRAERATVLEAVSGEREAAIQEATELVRSEREIILKETAGMVERTTDSAADHAERLIDHLMWRVLQLMVLAGAALLLAAILYLVTRRWHPQPKAS
jgi:hypothetical protein